MCRKCFIHSTHSIKTLITSITRTNLMKNKTKYIRFIIIRRLEVCLLSFMSKCMMLTSKFLNSCKKQVSHRKY